MNSILFQEEISAYAAIGRVQSCAIILPCMVGTSFVFAMLTRLNVSEPEH